MHEFLNSIFKNHFEKRPEHTYIPDWTEEEEEYPKKEYTDLEELQDEERRYDAKEDK